MKMHRKRGHGRWLVPVTASTLAVIMVLGLAAGASLAQQPLANSDYRTFLPIVFWAPEPTTLFEDDFENGAGQWTPYLQWSRLVPGQWYWDEDGGYQNSGGYAFHYSANGATQQFAEDAMTMVLGQGSEGWRDYRARVKFKVRSGLKTGLWFRGTYQEVENRGQWFLGYYCMVAVHDDDDKDNVQLLQMRTYEEPGSPPPAKDKNYYHFANPKQITTAELNKDLRHHEWYELVVEVRGPNIKCYVDDELAVNYTDTQGSIFYDGTIGLKLYGRSGNYAVMDYDDVVVEPLD